MTFDNTSLKILAQLPIATVVSETENQQIVWMNQIALDFFGLEEIPGQMTSLQLLRLSGDDLEWYSSISPGHNMERFQPVKLGGKSRDFPVVLDCTVTEVEGRIYRLDTFNTKNYDSLPVYEQYCYCFERTSPRLESVYKGMGKLGENINDILDVVLYVHAGDRAFIYEIDKDLCCAVDLYERCRKGFTGHNEKYKTLDRETINILCDKIDNGIDYSVITEENTVSFIRERMEKGMVVRTMGSPFTRRSGIKCFLCIDNPRRFWGMYSFLKHASYLLANDIHVDKIQGHLEASYLLNKSLAQSNANQVKIYMFGGFEIQTSNGILQDGSFRSPQVCSLISFLLLNRKRMLSIYEISEAIWPEQILDDPYNQIKSVVFRARKALEGVCKKPLIEASEGTYRINGSLDIWIDIEEFERLCKKAENPELPAEQRLELYHQAFQLYRGGMLPFVEPNLWIFTRINYYQILYMNMVNEYLEMLVKNNKCTEAFSVASTAISIEPSNFEVYNILLRSLVENNQYELARKYYQKISAHMVKAQREQFVQLWRSLTDNK